MSDLCIECNQTVRPLQHGITCDSCDRWQHRTCNTGITRKQYVRATRGRTVISFICIKCKDQTQQETDDDLVHIQKIMDVQCSDLLQDLDTAFSVVTGPDFDDDDELNYKSMDREPVVADMSDDFIDLPTDNFPDTPETYKVLQSGSSRGGQLLVSSTGYSFGIKRVNQSSINWRCSVRNQTNRCYATVIQKGDQYCQGVPTHTHPADVKLPMRKELFSKAKQLASDSSKPSQDVVTDILTAVPDSLKWLAPKKSLLARSTNRYLQKTKTFP